MRQTQAETMERYVRKKMRDPLWQEIARRYAAGETAKRLACIYDLRPGTVNGVVGRLGLRKHNGTPELREMIRLYEGGCNLSEIARLFDCTKQNVSLLLQQRAKMRSRGVHYRGWPDMIARGDW